MTDHDHHSDVLSELNPQHRALRQMIPEVYDVRCVESGGDGRRRG